MPTTLHENRPSAGIGVVEVQKPMFFFAISAGESACGRCKKLEVFCDFCCSNWSSGVVSWFARLLPGPAGRGFDSSLVRGRASQDATCFLKQLAQSNLRSGGKKKAPCSVGPTSLAMLCFRANRGLVYFGFSDGFPLHPPQQKANP